MRAAGAGASPGETDATQMASRSQVGKCKREDKAVVKSFLDRAQKVWESKGKPDVVPQIQNPPFPTRMPGYLAHGDNRFEKNKFDRLYACDGCGVLVGYNSGTRQTGSRAKANFEFGGSYVDQTWAENVPEELQCHAYEARLIDFTWYCSQWCDAPTTGGDKPKESGREAFLRRSGIIESEIEVPLPPTVSLPAPTGDEAGGSDVALGRLIASAVADFLGGRDESAEIGE